MKMKLALTVALIGLVVVFGCSKKDQPTEPAKTETDAPSTMDTLKDAAVQKAKDAFTMDIDLEKAVADLKAEAAQMDIESLKEVAAKYKDAITTKEAEVKTLMDKLSAIPMAEKMGKEAQQLTSDMKALTDAVSALKERFQVYMDALKAKGADVSALLG